MHAEIYALIWRLHLEGRKEKLREVFSGLLMMTMVEQHIPGLKAHMMKRRGLFKTWVSQSADYTFPAAQLDEIEYKFKSLERYLES